MKEWVEVIRDARYFNLLVTNTLELETQIEFEVFSRSGPVTVQYDGIRIVNHNIEGFENPPTHIAVSDAQCHATSGSTRDNIVPHAADPAPAQRAGNIAFIWSNPATRMTEVSPYRDDGFPAVVVAVGLSKHYTSGKLNRKKQLPAIKAEYLAALWYNNPDSNYRANGPSSIAFDNYKEFWIDGEFKGSRWTDINESWKHRVLDTPEDEDTLGEFLANLHGTTNKFTQRYFDNAEDEVCYMADFS